MSFCEKIQRNETSHVPTYYCCRLKKKNRQKHREKMAFRRLRARKFIKEVFLAPWRELFPCSLLPAFASFWKALGVRKGPLSMTARLLLVPYDAWPRRRRFDARRRFYLSRPMAVLNATMRDASREEHDALLFGYGACNSRLPRDDLISGHGVCRSSCVALGLHATTMRGA